MKINLRGTLAFSAIVAGLLFGTIPGAHADVGISTGSSSATYFAMANDIKRVCPAININVYESAGSLSNLDRIFADPKVQYGIVQQDALIYKNLQDPTSMSKIKQVFPLYNEEISVVVNTKSGINSLADMANKKVVIGAEGSGNWVTSNIIKSKTGIHWIDISQPPADSVVGLVSGQYDAMIVVAGTPVSFLKSMGASATGVVKMISINNPALDDFYIRASVPEGIYAWQSTPVQTYAVKSILATYDYKNPAMAAEITKLVTCIIKQEPNLEVSGHPKWKTVDPTSIEQVRWPIHPAALAAIKANAHRK
jgi:TRAP transporter TAXI family solute receptor